MSVEPPDEIDEQNAKHVTDEPAYLYLMRHQLALDICNLIESSRTGSGYQGVSAKEASAHLGFAIQTTTNALRRLERAGILKSEKRGRVRRYTPTGPFDFPVVVLVASMNTKAARKEASIELEEKSPGGALTSAPTEKLIIRNYPREMLIRNLTRELSAREQKGVTLTAPLIVETPLYRSQLDYAFKRGSETHAVLISRLDTIYSLLVMLGNLLRLSSRENAFDSLLLLVLLDEPSATHGMLTSNSVMASRISEVVKPLFKNKLVIIVERATDLTIMTPDYAKKMSQKIWAALSSRLGRS